MNFILKFLFYWRLGQYLTPYIGWLIVIGVVIAIFIKFDIYFASFITAVLVAIILTIIVWYALGGFCRKNKDSDCVITFMFALCIGIANGYFAYGDLKAKEIKENATKEKTRILTSKEKTIIIQQKLIKNGYRIKADGIFGKNTLRNAQKFLNTKATSVDEIYEQIKDK